jgi:hypothetical protein
VFVIVSSGDPTDNRALAGRFAGRHMVLLQQRNEVELIYFVRGTPTAFLLDPAGVTETGRIEGAPAILGLLAALRSSGQPLDPGITPVDRNPAQALVPLRPGDLLPAARLPTLDGGELVSPRLTGERSLLVIFDPLCAPCLALLPRLAELETGRSGPRVVLVSRRDPELTRAHLAASRPGPALSVAFQRDWDFSRALGVLAAPVACVVDQDGHLEAELAVGREAIEALLKRIPGQSGERRLVSLSSLLRA